jgi:hypothetical protein
MYFYKFIKNINYLQNAKNRHTAVGFFTLTEKPLSYLYIFKLIPILHYTEFAKKMPINRHA